jgi:hypothetical protein
MWNLTDNFTTAEFDFIVGCEILFNFDEEFGVCEFDAFALQWNRRFLHKRDETFYKA